MSYTNLIEEELAIMWSQISHTSKSLSPHEIRVPLHLIMNQAITVDMGTSTLNAIEEMISHDVGYVLVVSDGVLKGIFGERDALLKVMNRPVGDLGKIPVEHFMKVDLQTLRQTDCLDRAILFMARGDYRHMPIVDDRHQPVGMVSIRHIISYIVEHFPQEILTLPPQPMREGTEAREGA